MANLIIKPTSGGSLILQDEGGTAAHTIDASGNHTLSGTTNNVGTVTAGTIGTGVTKKIHAFNAYVSATDCAIPDSSWTEATAVGTWTELFDSLGHYASGRFTPTVQGIYLCGFSATLSELDANEHFICAIRKNGVSTAGNQYAYTRDRNPGSGSGYTLGLSGSSIIQLDTNDYVSLWCHHNEGATQNLSVGETGFWGTYIGTV